MRPESVLRVARHLMVPFRGATMSLDLHPAASAEPEGHQGLQSDRREKLLTVLAVSLGVTIVAAIAVLMGMA